MARETKDKSPVWLLGTPVAESIAIGLLVFAACWLGIQTRTLFSLASIWPANPLLLGLLLLRPSANRPLTWVLAASAYVFADGMTGSDLVRSIALNAANLAGIGVGMIAVHVLAGGVLRMDRPIHTIYAVIIMTAAAAGSGLGGMYVGPMLFGMAAPESFLLWFASELAGYSIILPVAISFALPGDGRLRIFSRDRVLLGQQLAALSTLGALIAAVHLFGGPGAIAYLIPGLLWCAIRFRPFAVSVIAMLVCGWVLTAGPLGLIPLHFSLTEVGQASSFRIGVAMIALCPFAVSSLNAAWRSVHADLQHIANHDALTHLLNRGAFMDRFAASVRKAPIGTDFCLLMIDVDHFKSINDTHGHMVGDDLLAAIAATLARTVRPSDTIGRIGGEEFAVLALGAPASAVAELGERLRTAAAAVRVPGPAGTPVGTTVSIGVARCHVPAPIGDALTEADHALYAAKRTGRDRVVVAPSGRVQTMPEPA